MTSPTVPAPAPLARSRSRHHTVRMVAAGLAVITALLYYLIATRWVTVILDKSGQQDSGAQIGFGLAAGTAFLLGAVVILRTDRRWLWVLGALGQAWVILMYVTVAPSREPHFETWGIVIRVVQLGLLAALVYLAATPSDRADDAAGTSPSRT